MMRLRGESMAWFCCAFSCQRTQFSKVWPIDAAMTDADSCANPFNQRPFKRHSVSKQILSFNSRPHRPTPLHPSVILCRWTQPIRWCCQEWRQHWRRRRRPKHVRLACGRDGPSSETQIQARHKIVRRNSIQDNVKAPLNLCGSLCIWELRRTAEAVNCAFALCFTHLRMVIWICTSLFFGSLVPLGKFAQYPFSELESGWPQHTTVGLHPRILQGYAMHHA